MALSSKSGWKSKAILTSAKENRGIEELSKIIDEHNSFLESSGQRIKLSERRRRFEFEETLKNLFFNKFTNEEVYLKKIDEILSGSSIPSVAAIELTQSIKIIL